MAQFDEMDLRVAGEDDNDPQNDSEDPLQNTSGRSVARGEKCKRIQLPILYGLVFLLICGIVINIVLIQQHKEPEDSTPNSLNPSARTGDLSESSCIYNSPRSFLDNISEELDVEFCKPQVLHTGVIVGWGLCNQNTNEYIRKQCLCDSRQQCSTSRVDLFYKHNCTACRDKDHCPCVYGKCFPCRDVNNISLPKCDCVNGAEGKFCTKLAKRLCVVMKETRNKENLPYCNETNNEACVLKTNMYTFKCNFSEDHLPSVQDCFNYQIVENGNTAEQSMETKDGSSKGTSLQKGFLIGLLAILSVALVILVVYIAIKRKDTYRND